MWSLGHCNLRFPVKAVIFSVKPSVPAISRWTTLGGCSRYFLLLGSGNIIQHNNNSTCQFLDHVSSFMFIFYIFKFLPGWLMTHDLIHYSDLIGDLVQQTQIAPTKFDVASNEQLLNLETK